MGDDSQPIRGTVSIRVADAEQRRRVVDALAHRAIPAETFLVVEGGDADFALPAEASDDIVHTAIELLAKLAAERGRLAAARSSENRFARLAATDALTGLPNRRAWDEALTRTAGSGEPPCVVILDLDEFKRVNDEHGHTVGDAVLRATADGLRSAIRRGDMAARIGGDEFGLLLPGLAPEHAPRVVERMRQSVQDAIVEAGLPPTTCAAGYATTFAEADRRLRAAKQGR